MSIKKDLTMKAAAEIFKLASRIGIKPRDIIGQGADVIKMGKSLFNTKVNPALTEFISSKGKIPTKILEDIKIHLRSLKSVSESQLELFKLNLKDIVNAKFPKPVSSGKKLATEAEKDIAFIDDTIQSLNKTEAAADAFSASLGTRKYYLNELKNTYPNHYRTLTGKETKDQLKEMIYRLDTEGIPFNEGGIAALNAELNQLPEYYLPMAEGGRIPYGIGDWVKKKIKKKIKPYTKEGRDEFKKEWLKKKNIDMTVKEWNALPLKEKAKIWFREGNATGGRAGFDQGSDETGVKLSPILSMVNTSETPVEGIDVDVSDIDYGIAGMFQGDTAYVGGEYTKGKVKVNVQQDGNTVFEDSMSKDDLMQLYVGLGEKSGNHVEVGTDGQGNYTLNIIKSFADGGIATHFRAR